MSNLISMKLVMTLRSRSSSVSTPCSTESRISLKQSPVHCSDRHNTDHGSFSSRPIRIPCARLMLKRIFDICMAFDYIDINSAKKIQQKILFAIFFVWCMRKPLKGYLVFTRTSSVVTFVNFFAPMDSLSLYCKSLEEVTAESFLKEAAKKFSGRTTQKKVFV